MNSNADISLTVRLPATLADELDKLATATGKNRDSITAAALHAYIESEANLIADIKAGLAEAERGEFASKEEVNAFFAKYGG